MRKLIASTSLLALAATGIAVGTTDGVATAARPGAARAGHTATAFAMKTSGFGTRVRGGQVPAGSGSTAYTVIGCTNMAGTVHRNKVTDVQLPGAGTIGAVTTKVWTHRKHGTVITHSRSTTADIVLASSGLGRLAIAGVRSDSKVWHDRHGFHAQNTADVARIKFTVAGTTQTIPLPDPGQTVTVPGLARISLGRPGKSVTRGGARAHNDVLNVQMIPSDTRVRIGHTVAEMSGGIKSGIFGGYGSALKVRAADDNIATGRVPFQPMPCQGTGGKTVTRNTAGVNLADQIEVGAVESTHRANQTMKRAGGFQEAKVASINIGGGALVVDGIEGRVNVRRSGKHLGHVVRNTRGTTIGSITANGQAQSIPDPGDTLTIPGVAKLESGLTKKIRGGISVTSLRITLLDGTGAVLDLGQAKLFVRRSGR